MCGAWGGIFWGVRFLIIGEFLVLLFGWRGVEYGYEGTAG